MGLILSAVGHGAKAIDWKDVKIVRILLNFYITDLNKYRVLNNQSILTPMVEKGLKSKKDMDELIDRIKCYQLLMKKSNPAIIADGRIDPDSATEKKLIEGLASGFSVKKIELVEPWVKFEDTSRYDNFFQKLLDYYSINTNLRRSNFIGQVLVESDKFRTAQEYADGSEYEGRTNLGNTQAGDGPRFKGRGLIQLTGRKNYEEFEKYMNISFTGLNDGANRDKISQDPWMAIVVSCWFWSKNSINDWCDADNAKNVSKLVNAGSINKPDSKVNGLKERLDYTKRAKIVKI